MSVSVVNGYVCTSGCDEAKARQGINPNAPPGTLPDEDHSNTGLAARPATVLGGALTRRAGAAGGVSTAPAIHSDTRASGVNRLA